MSREYLERIVWSVLKIRYEGVDGALNPEMPHDSHMLPEIDQLFDRFDLVPPAPSSPDVESEAPSNGL